MANDKIDPEVVENIPVGATFVDETDDAPEKTEPTPTPKDDGSRANERTWHQGPQARGRGRRKPEDLAEMDERWLDLLEDHLAGSEILEIRCRKGANPYKPLFSQKTTMLVGQSARENAERLGREIWRECVKYTQKKGPVMDWQLLLFGRESKKHKLVELGVQAIRISLLGPMENDEDDPNIDDNAVRLLLSSASGLIREMKDIISDNREERKSLVDANTKLVTSSTDAIDAAIGLVGKGIQLVETGAQYHGDLLDQRNSREEARYKAEYSTAKVQAIADGIKTASEIVTGETTAAIFHWLATKNPGVGLEPVTDMREGASRLLDSLTMKQAAIIGDDFDDLCVALKSASEATDDPLALPALGVAFKIIEPLKDKLKKSMTPEQTLIFGFMKGRASAEGTTSPS